MKIFSNTISLLEKSLDYSSIKQKVIAQNIANVDTPNYKAKDVSFQSVLNKELNQSFQVQMTHEKHIPITAPMRNTAIISTDRVRYHHNGNSVDMDTEMVKLAQNQIYNNALIERINGKFLSLETVIKGGK